MHFYIKLSTGEYPRYEGDIRAEHPEILESQTYPNFPCPPTYAFVEVQPPSDFNPATHRARLAAPVQADGKWTASHIVEPIPADVLGPRVREERTRILAASDWTQLADAPLTADQRAAWSTYRQQLRDIPAQPGFPWEVEWPAAPNFNQ